MVVNNNAGTGNIQHWQHGVGDVAAMLPDGTLGAKGIANFTSINNALMLMQAGGALIKRNIADSSPALVINQANAASTGDILQLSSNTNTVVAVRSNGNMLIGKTSQTNANYKLDINGIARANAVVVNSTGADFVFEPDYKLPELSEIKSYIDKNHHLPGIPSASEMKIEGLNIGEINTKLLQKVEELTLYVIRQKEDNKKLIDENKTLREEQQKAIKALQEQVTRLAKKQSKK